MKLDFKTHPHCYLITHHPTGETYVGVVLKTGKTYLDRLEEHLTKRGAIGFHRFIDDKNFDKNDFSSVLLQCYEIKHHALKAETALIKSLKPTINQNCGGGYDWGYYKMRGWDKSVYTLRIQYRDLSPLQRFIESTAFSQLGEKLHYHKDFRAKHGSAYIKLLNQLKKINYDITLDENWINGRRIYKQRMNDKLYTEKEKNAFKNRSVVVKKQWERMNDKEIFNKTKAGLDKMNAQVECEYCGKTTNRGNYGRWHGKKCKYAPNQANQKSENYIPSQFL